MRQFYTRTGFFLVLVIILGSLLLVQLSSNGPLASEKCLQYFAGGSWQVGTLPGMRGRILDERGTPLVWSIRIFSLVYDANSGMGEFWQDLLSLAEIIPLDINLNAQGEVEGELLLKNHLTAKEIMALQPFITDHYQFKIISRFERRYVTDDPSILEGIGKTVIKSGREVGISGIEAMYNERLTGIDGKYRVMVDSSRNWIPETWQELQAPEPGYDLYVSLN